MAQNVAGDIDISAIVNGQAIDASDVTVPFTDTVAVINDILNGEQAFDQILFEDATVLTIASGSVTTTQTVHTIAAQSGTADDLDTVVADNGKFLFIRADTGDTITVKHGTGNISIIGGNDIALTGNTALMLFCLDDEWSVIGGGGAALSILNLGDTSELTIASGAITFTQSHHTVDTQADAASDDLDTINGGSNGDVLVIHAENDSRTVTVKHATGNIELNGGIDFELDNTAKGLLLVYQDGVWTGIGGPFTSGAGSGTVTSIQVAAPADIFSVSGGPISTSGTITLAKVDQVANRVLAGPTGGADAAPTFRALVAADLPTVTIAKGGTGQTSKTAAFDALSPVTTTGDLIYRNASNNVRLGIGSEGHTLKVVSGLPAWAAGGGAEIVTGSYVGNAVDGRTITTGSDGRTPKMILLTRDSTGLTFIRHGSGPCVTLADSSIPGSSVNQIQSIIANGFTVGSGTPNASGQTAHWIAFYGS